MQDYTLPHAGSCCLTCFTLLLCLWNVRLKTSSHQSSHSADEDSGELTSDKLKQHRRICIFWILRLPFSLPHFPFIAAFWNQTLLFYSAYSYQSRLKFGKLCAPADHILNLINANSFMKATDKINQEFLHQLTFKNMKSLCLLPFLFQGDE